MTVAVPPNLLESAIDPERFDGLSRSFSHLSPRRRVLSGLATGLILRPVETAAKKRGKKRRKKRHPELSACVRACGSNCNFCVTRATGPLVCGEGTVAGCDATCSSDFDCFGMGFRYCITTLEEVETGQVSAVCETPGGHCANIQACEV